MYALTIAFGQPAVVWQLVFKTKETAETVWKKYYDGISTIEITDDFGQTVRIAAKNIIGIMLENMTESAQAHIARALHQQRMQAQTLKAAESDPQIRAAMRGPAVLSPVPQFNGR